MSNNEEKLLTVDEWTAQFIVALESFKRCVDIATKEDENLQKLPAQEWSALFIQVCTECEEEVQRIKNI